MTAPAERRMSRVDTAWLRMDNDVNLMMIVGVWMLQPGITHAALCERIADKLLKYDRFRQRVVQDAVGASWVEDEHFDIERHVVREVLEPRPGQSMREALQEPVRKVIGAIKSVLERTPPELASDLVDTGITLCGGGSLLRGLPDLIARETELDVRVAERPLEAVARGTGIFLVDTLKYSKGRFHAGSFIGNVVVPLAAGVMTSVSRSVNGSGVQFESDKQVLAGTFIGMGTGMLVGLEAPPIAIASCANTGARLPLNSRACAQSGVAGRGTTRGRVDSIFRRISA